jgi:DNA-binding beta-propeller fold protein YncE
MMRSKLSLLCALLAVTGAAKLPSAAKVATLVKIAEFDLPGPPGKRFDYLTIDADDHYLISAHLAAKQTYIIDLRTNKVIATITDTPGAEGVEYVPEFHKFYTSNAYDNTIGVVDLKQMKVIKKLKTEAKPDGSTYAAPFHKLYVSDERGKAEAIVDVTKDEIIKTLHFDSETGMPQYDPVARKVYVNLQDRNIFAVIDPATDEVMGRYPVGRCEGNHGMTLDPERHRAFLSCEGNDLMTVFNLDTHQPIAFLPMANGPDVIAFDPGLNRIYVACSSGAISVFEMDDPDHYHKLEDFPVQKQVHSLVVDRETHRVYTPEQQADGKGVARMVVYDAVTKKNASSSENQVQQTPKQN